MAFCFGVIEEMLDVIELESKLESFLEERGFNLVDFQIARFGRSHTFRVFVEHTNGNPADLSDCAWLSPMVSVYLESLGVFSSDSVLEVSSPGLDRIIRKLKDFERFTGHLVKVKVLFEGKRMSVLGRLRGATDDEVALAEIESPKDFLSAPGVRFEEGVLLLPRENIEQVRLKPEV